LTKPLYVPILKTSDAELRGYENLTDDAKNQILPLFELTKGRRTKSDSVGLIQKRIDRLVEILGDKPFILDLTAHDDQLNIEIQELFDDEGNFDKWCTFVENLPFPNVIPAVHMYEDSEPKEIEAQVRRLEQHCGKVAFRADLNDTNIRAKLLHYIGMALGGLSSPNNLIVILDLGFVDQTQGMTTAMGVASLLANVDAMFALPYYVVASSSFPSAVGKPPYGNDESGRFNMEEVLLEQALKTAFKPEKVVYGDFAAIHPIRYQIRGGTWIPRVDIPCNAHYVYTRYRRDDGGYIKAAKAIKRSPYFESIGCWGDDEIENAANEKPSGRSPSFWISVRTNIHMHKQLIRLSE